MPVIEEIKEPPSPTISEETKEVCVDDRTPNEKYADFEKLLGEQRAIAIELR